MTVSPIDIERFNNSELEELFNRKLTENGDETHCSTGNILFDLFFQSAFYEKHLDLARIGDSDIERLFSMFIRDPRHGIGRRDLGRVLMLQSGVSAENVAKCGRFDDLWENPAGQFINDEWVKFLAEEAKAGNNLAKKWMPHYVAKNRHGKVAKSTLAAAKMRRIIGLDKQGYNKLVKTDTVESMLSQHQNNRIEFDKIPSLALLKYWARFAGTSVKNPKTDMAERFNAYLESVRKGEKKMNFSTATVYDIYRNRGRIDADLAFAQIPKCGGSWIPVVDTSGSMFDSNDSIGKALAVGHYLGKTSTYCPNQVVTFSSEPKLITLGTELPENELYPFMSREIKDYKRTNAGSEYGREISSMLTGDCSNTNFGAVMDLFGELKDEFPEYIIVLSDMEFDAGSSRSNNETMRKWRENGVGTKLVWWNFNPRAKTSAQSVRTDEFGNFFFSGYNPTLLRFLDCGFSMSQLLATILTEYSEKIGF